MTEIKFCGMTRAEDAAEAATLGAAYVGVIFAAGPRRLTAVRAASVLAAVPTRVRAAGVFSDSSVDAMAETAGAIGLRVLQLHGEYDSNAITKLRAKFQGEIWSVLCVANGSIPETAAELFASSDAVLLDAHVRGRLGGTGVTLPWSDLQNQLVPLREVSSAKLVMPNWVSTSSSVLPLRANHRRISPRCVVVQPPHAGARSCPWAPVASGPAGGPGACPGPRSASNSASSRSCIR